MKAWIGKVLGVCLCLVTAAWAQSVETFRLQHRSAEQLLPQVATFVGPGGAVTGSGDQLFVRAAPANLAQIRKLVASLDTPVRRLMISIRSEGAGSEGGNQVTADRRDGVRVYRSDQRSRRNVQQQLQTIDGEPASIYVGQSLWLPLRQTIVTPTGAVVEERVVQRDLGAGFVALPRLHGERVTLEVGPMEDRPGLRPGTVNVQRLFTTVSGRLGEWIELGGEGGGAGEETAQVGNSAHYGTRRGASQQRLWLKVDELR